MDYKDHLIEKIEEECLCTFVLSWLHGPNEGNLSPTNIADICIVRSSSPPNSTLASFSNLAKDRIKKALLRSTSVSEVCHSGPTCPSGKRKSISPKDGLQASYYVQNFCIIFNYHCMCYLQVFEGFLLVLGYGAFQEVLRHSKDK